MPAFGAVDCLVPVAGDGGGDVVVLSALTEGDRHLEVVGVGEVRVHQLLVKWSHIAGLVGCLAGESFDKPDMRTSRGAG